MQKGQATNFIFGYRYLIWIGYLFMFEFGQELFDDNSIERVDFFFCNLYAWILTGLCILYYDRKLFLKNILSVYILRAAIAFVAYKLYDNIVNNGEGLYDTMAFLVSGLMIFIPILNLTWMEFFDKSIIESLLGKKKLKQ